MCGPGLSGNMDVYVGGSNFGSTVNDVVVRNIAAVSCEGGAAASSGIAFAISVSPNDTPGARSIYLHSPNGDISTFTGGFRGYPVRRIWFLLACLVGVLSAMATTLSPMTIERLARVRS